MIYYVLDYDNDVTLSIFPLVYGKLKMLFFLFMSVLSLILKIHVFEQDSA